MDDRGILYFILALGLIAVSANGVALIRHGRGVNERRLQASPARYPWLRLSMPRLAILALCLLLYVAVFAGVALGVMRAGWGADELSVARTSNVPDRSTSHLEITEALSVGCVLLWSYSGVLAAAAIREERPMASLACVLTLVFMSFSGVWLLNQLLIEVLLLG